MAAHSKLTETQDRAPRTSGHVSLAFNGRVPLARSSPFGLVAIRTLWVGVPGFIGNEPVARSHRALLREPHSCRYLRGIRRGYPEACTLALQSQSKSRAHRR